MLADKDRIFLNLYGVHGADLESAKKRGAWNGTADILSAPDFRRASSGRSCRKR
jgi:NADH-quinone oxidoreductase subunit F